MDSGKETIKTIQGRLDVLKKSLVSEENSVQYYQTLVEKTPTDTEEGIGSIRMFEDLREEEKGHVQTIKDLISHWEKKMSELQ